MREKVTFNLRSPFPELESICYLFNKMMISGKGNHAELKIGKSKDIDYITINVYRCRKYPSVTLNRDVDLIDFETENIATHTEEETILHNMDEPVMPSFNFGQKKEENLTSMNELQTGAADDMELPANVAVLKQLIAKLPSGVSKQTGAQIIKQTMEALGISMAGVLQEAQQVQESLNQSARDCQNNILEYKKQINVLEAQAHKYQKQFAVVNDIISLFIQTNN